MEKNKIERGRRALIIFGVILFALSALAMIGGIALITVGAVVAIVFGVVLVLLAIFLLLFSIYFVWVGASQVATNGSLKQGNMAKNGTVNARLCSKCGNELPKNAVHCPKCGQTASSCKVCECGAENNMENTKCTSCGKDL